MAIVLRDGADDSLVRQSRNSDRHLMLALAARSITLRSLTGMGDLVMIGHEEVDGCEHIANRILELNPDAELAKFARELLDRVQDSRRWEWTLTAVGWHIAAVVLFGLLPVVLGGLAGLVFLIVFGVLLGTALTVALVLSHRKQQWLLRAESLAPMLARAGR